MKFKLTTSGYFYTNARTVDRLTRLVFTFVPDTIHGKPCQRKLVNSSEVFVDIGSLEELISFVNDHGRVIIDDDHIEIYDDYCE